LGDLSHFFGVIVAQLAHLAGEASGVECVQYCDDRGGIHFALENHEVVAFFPYWNKAQAVDFRRHPNGYAGVGLTIRDCRRDFQVTA
jgi:hypothetical protein